ncbi:MAG TPA: ComEA family DNA-binding protein, partial [Pilimelia sp.]|nr:ComEA family DNA-binding protein [Pilimelia sp.]
MSEADSDEAAAARRRLRGILGDPAPASAGPSGGPPPRSAAPPDDTGARPVAPDDGGEATPGAIRRAVRLTGPGAFDPGRRGVRALALVAV